MDTLQPLRIRSITEFHRSRNLPLPEHPLISVVNYADIYEGDMAAEKSFVFDYYTVSLKRGVSKMIYGQQPYDFDEGVMYFMAPGQVLRVQPSPNSKAQRSGWLLLIHPDFLWNSPLANNIKKYEFFDYAVNEALFLSDKEEATLNGIVENIKSEYHSNIDKFSQSIIISQIETLLNYSERFYQRQFITRKISNHEILERLERYLTDYFKESNLSLKGLPTAQQVADELHLSVGYLSSLLKMLTGQTTQQHIHNKLLDRAKIKLSTTNMSVSEIAYELGFEHPQSFSKLFKSKTKQSPLEFRQSFN